LNPTDNTRAPEAESLQQERQRVATEERADAWWYRIYLAVVVVAVLMITGLWIFSRVFSA